MLRNKPIKKRTAREILEDHIGDEETLAEAFSFVSDVADKRASFDALPEDLHDILSNHGVDILDDDEYYALYGDA